MARHRARARTATAATDPRRPDGALQERLRRATVHHRNGELDAALAGYETVLRTEPGNPVAANLSGLILFERGHHASARTRFALALRQSGPHDANRANIANNLGLACAALGDDDAAIEAFAHALALAPDHVHALHNLALAQRRRGNLDAAAGAARAALAIEPERSDSLGLLGTVLLDQGRLGAAAGAFRRAVALGEPSGDAHAGLGNTLRLLGRCPEAVRSLERAVAVRPDRADFRSTLALALFGAGRAEEALAQADEAAAQPGADRAVRINSALLHLAAGDPEGWDRLERARGRAPLGDLGGVDVFVVKEEGVGDQLLYATCLSDLARTARSVVVECDPRLRALLERSQPGITFVDAPGTPPPGHTAIGLGALPGRLRRYPQDVAPPTTLQARPEAVQEWADWLAGLGPGPKVGISWRSMLTDAERRAEYAAPADWAPVLTRPGITFVNLQYDECAQELAAIHTELGVHVIEPPDLDLMRDLDGVAALMTAIDAVMAPRNAVVMLAGALGRPAVMLGNRRDWFDLGLDIERTGYPWFTSIRPVLRDPADEWGPTLERAAAVLDRLLCGAQGAPKKDDA